MLQAVVTTKVQGRIEGLASENRVEREYYFHTRHAMFGASSCQMLHVLNELVRGTTLRSR